MIPITPEDRKIAHELLDYLLDRAEPGKDDFYIYERLWFDDNRYIPWRKPNRTRYTISFKINQIEP